MYVCGFSTMKVWLEQNSWATEPFGADVDDVLTQKLVGSLCVRASCSGFKFCTLCLSSNCAILLGRDVDLKALFSYVGRVEQTMNEVSTGRASISITPA